MTHERNSLRRRQKTPIGGRIKQADDDLPSFAYNGVWIPRNKQQKTKSFCRICTASRSLRQNPHANRIGGTLCFIGVKSDEAWHGEPVNTLQAVESRQEKRPHQLWYGPSLGQHLVQNINGLCTLDEHMGPVGAVSFRLRFCAHKIL